ncbi:MAG: sulfur relay protein TusB/DsrH [Pseudohongiellaceae bacterium]|jgi:sulfur relay protein TusB/DsrH
MTTLHTISKPPAAGLLEICLPLLKAGDCVLFTEDGVYHCMVDNQLFDSKNGVKCCVLTEDAHARGLKNRLCPKVNLTDTAGYVELCVRFDQVVNWF